MAKRWIQIFSEKGDAWRLTEEMINRLRQAVDVAAIEEAIPANSRNAVSHARRRSAFDELAAAMRDIKKRCFYEPPLTSADFIMLGLKPKDAIPTPAPDPVGLAEASISYPRRTQLKLLIRHITGSSDDAREYYGCRIYYGTYSPGETLPASGKDLRESRFTRRQRELFMFQPEDSGKTACFCLRYENSKGVAGPWGPLVSAIIP